MSNICATFVLCCQLAELSGVKSIRDLPACWEHRLDKDWHLSFNGHSQPTRNLAGETVPAISILAQHSSVLTLAVISPAGGMMVGACEDELITALEVAIRSLGGVPATQEEDEEPTP